MSDPTPTEEAPSGRAPGEGRPAPRHRPFQVGGALIIDDGALLLVKNRRRNGSHDWTPPGGVIELERDESILDGLAREVLEETGLRVLSWQGPLYQVEATSETMGFQMAVEVWLATEFEGEVTIGNDPDGIVVDAAWVPVLECAPHLADGHLWVREPLGEWLVEQWAELRRYRYRVTGTGLSDAIAERVHDPD